MDFYVYNSLVCLFEAPLVGHIMFICVPNVHVRILCTQTTFQETSDSYNIHG